MENIYISAYKGDSLLYKSKSIIQGGCVLYRVHVHNMVLNNEEIIAAISNENVKITEYTWDEKLEKKDFDVQKLKGGHKIRLHVGFLIRTLSDKRWINPKTLYNKRDGIVDLRKLDDHQYTLKPKESVLLFTNESIELGSGYFGLLLSRVSHEENGLIVSPSYIDPNWSGVVQIVVTNNSESEQLLRENCEIVNLVLMKIEKQNDTAHNRNDHYGVTWETISNNPIFPKWQNRKRSIYLKLMHLFRTYWVLSAGVGFIGIVGAIYYIIMIITSIINIINQ